MGRDHNYQRLIGARFVLVLNLCQQIQAAHPRQIDVEQQQIERLVAHQGLGFFRAAGFTDIARRVLQRAPDAIARRLFVIHNQQSQAVLFHCDSSSLVHFEEFCLRIVCQ